MTYINSDGPKMLYINKRPINCKKVETNNKVTWCQNIIQSIVLLLYTNALSCMSNYIVTVSSAYSVINPSILRHCLWYINVPRSVVMMIYKTSLTSNPWKKIHTSMSGCAISIMWWYLGKTSSTLSNCGSSSSSITWWAGLDWSPGAACTIYWCDTLKNHLTHPRSCSRSGLLYFVSPLVPDNSHNHQTWHPSIYVSKQEDHRQKGV